MLKNNFAIAMCLNVGSTNRSKDQTSSLQQLSIFILVLNNQHVSLTFTALPNAIIDSFKI